MWLNTAAIKTQTNISIKFLLKAAHPIDSVSKVLLFSKNIRGVEKIVIKIQKNGKIISGASIKSKRNQNK